MLISLNWLKQYIDLEGIEINELENALTMIGQEVEKIDRQGSNLDNIVVAQIIEKESHPESDHLTVCKVDNGTEIQQVICGAPNHKKGDKVILAQIGANLGEDFVIKKTKIRGMESNGMLCSEKELGLGQAHEGIMILPEDAKVGTPAKEYFKLSDVIFELEITPNRPDCLSHIGIARELAVYYDKELKMPNTKIENETTEKVEDLVTVEIDDTEISRRYAARIVKNVKIGESPKWLKERLESIGLRSINNVVDISNFVLMELNHPIHTFDYNKIQGNKIIVRRAKENEKVVTLDDQERELASEDIVIADANRVVAIAGVMGAANSEVDENTTNILIEVAHFEPTLIRKTSKKLTLSSDASYRFERGVDLEDAEKVINRVANLIKEVAGGDILEGIVDNYPIKHEKKLVELNIPRLNKFVGKEIPEEKIIKIFENLEVQVTKNGDNLSLIAPSFREDLEREQDYYEEVIRIYGFDNIEDILPKLDMNSDEIVDTTLILDNVKDIAASVGLKEVINYSFIPRDGLEKINFTRIAKDNTLEVLNPITEDFVIMKPTLIYSLLKNAKDNLSRNFSNINFFEVSRTFEKGEKLAKEDVKLGIILAGEPNKYLWDAKPKKYDFYDLKGIVEEILSKMKFNNYTIKRTEQTELHPGRGADIFVGREFIGSFGEIHPDVLEKFGLEKESILVAELNIDLIKKYTGKKVSYKGISKFPAVPRDLALVIDDQILVGDVIKTLEKVSPLIEKVELFDVYQGIGLGLGKKSIAISIVIRDKNKTLVEEEINGVVSKILEKVKKDYNAELRQ